MEKENNLTDKKGWAVWRKRLPILVILVAAVIGTVTLRDFITFDELAKNQARLVEFTHENFVLSSLVFIAIYVVIVAFSFPGAAIATLAGGFLFGLFPGALYNVIGASLGAIAVFLAARAGFGADVAAKTSQGGGPAAKLQSALRENEWSALLIMRLVPVVPFFVANLVPAFFGTSLYRFALTTVLGIIPGTVVFTSIGAGLGEVFERAEQPDLSIIFAPYILGPLLGLAALSALPIVIKKFKKGHDEHGSH